MGITDRLINDWTAKRLLDRQFFSVDVENTDMSLEERALYFYQEFFCRVVHGVRRVLRE